MQPLATPPPLPGGSQLHAFRTAYGHWNEPEFSIFCRWARDPWMSRVTRPVDDGGGARGGSSPIGPHRVQDWRDAGWAGRGGGWWEVGVPDLTIDGVLDVMPSRPPPRSSRQFLQSFDAAASRRPPKLQSDGLRVEGGPRRGGCPAIFNKMKHSLARGLEEQSTE